MRRFRTAVMVSVIVAGAQASLATLIRTTGRRSW